MANKTIIKAFTDKAGVAIGATDLTVSSSLKLPDGTLGTPALHFDSDTDMGLYKVATDSMSWVTAGANAVTIDASQRVGIGTTGPGAVLDVRGDAVFNEDGGDFNFRIESDTRANAFDLDGGTGRIGMGEFTAPDSVQTATVAIRKNSADANNLELYRQSAAGGWGLHVTNSATGNLEINKVLEGTVGTKMVIQDNSYVGIGQSSPVSIFGGPSLHIGGDTNGNSSIVMGNNTSSQEGASPIISFRNYRGSLGGAAEMSIGFRSDPRYIRIGPDSGLASATGMVIEHGGNVGIGTTSPGAPLEINTAGSQQLLVKQNNSSSFPAEINSSSASAYGLHINCPSSAVATREMIRCTNSAGVKFIVRTDGRVAIGKLGSDAPLDVRGEGTGGAITFKTENSSGQGRFTVTDNGILGSVITSWGSSATQNVGFSVTTGTGTFEKFTSSIRYKEDVQPLTFDSASIYQLQAKEYRRKDSGIKEFGLIAEEVSEILPQVTCYQTQHKLDSEGNPTKEIEFLLNESGERIPESVDYRLLSVLCIEEMKKLSAKVTSLEEKQG